MIAYLFPGQGSQTVHMYELLYGHEDVVKEVFEVASDVSGINVKALCQTASIETLTRTENTQLAVSAMNCAFWKMIEAEGVRPDLVAGHSLGQYSALICCGALSLYDGFKLISRRAKAMCGVRRKGVLCAIIGSELQTVIEICSRTSDASGLVTVALYNTPSQIVIGGDHEYVSKAASAIKDAGALKTQLLNVDNAFHTGIMGEMEAEFSQYVDTIEFHKPTCRILLNCKGGYAESTDEIRNDIKQQSCHAVLWSTCMQMLVKQPDLQVAEVGVGTVLSGMLKKHDRKLKPFAMSDENARRSFIQTAKELRKL